MDNIREINPEVPERAVTLIKEVINTETAKMLDGPNSVMEQMVDVYAQHFTHDDIKGLLAFYTSPVGQKAVKALPVLTQRGAEIGRKWGEDNMPKVLEILQQRLRKEGVIP